MRPASHRELAPLVEAARFLGRDELRVVTLLVERLRDGAGVYGVLDITRDRRRFRREALEECVDGLFYAACALLRRDTR